MRNPLDETIKNRINNNIKFLLESTNTSQSALAIAIDKNVSHVNALLNGRGTPTLEFIINVSNYFNITIDDLIYKDMKWGLLVEDRWRTNFRGYSAGVASTVD